MKLQNLDMKRHFVCDKIIIGIDPCKKKYQAMIIDEKGIPTFVSIVHLGWSM